MVAKIKFKNEREFYYCSNCYMRLTELQPRCWYCGALLTNYEDMLVEEYENARQEDIKEKKDGVPS